MLIFTVPLLGFVITTNPTQDDFKPHNPLNWSTTEYMGDGWYFENSIGYFYPIIGNPFTFENDWYYRLDQGWSLWTAGWVERRVSDGNGYISYLWPDYTLIYDLEEGWLSTHHSYFPWIYSHSKGEWEVITSRWW